MLEEECAAFERQYREAMVVAAETLDVTGVDDLLRAWHRIGELTGRDGPEKRRQILAEAVRIWRNCGNRIRTPSAACGSSRMWCASG